MVEFLPEEGKAPVPHQASQPRGLTPGKRVPTISGSENKQKRVQSVPVMKGG